jgi:hypothetical protein
MNRTLIVAVSCCALATSASADAIFNNATNDIKVRFNPGTFEVGDQVVLAGNARYLTNFAFEYWGTNATAAGNPAFSGSVEARVRFYKNDGAAFNGYAAPGTCFYTSAWFSVSPTARNVFIFRPGVDFPASGLYLPASEMTWTVQFRGMGATDQVGVDFYTPAVVGLDHPDYWQRSGDRAPWALMTNSVPTDFAAIMEATLVPEHAIPFVAISTATRNAVLSWPGWATNFVLETSSALGPGTASWTPITSGIVWKDNNFVLTNTIAAGDAFFRLHLP